MIRSVTLIGSSSGRNAGDATLMSSIIDAVDRACGTPLRYEIPTIRPRYIRNHYPGHARPVGILPWNLSVKMLGLPTFRSIMRTDLTLIFDAVLFDRSLYNPLFNFLSSLYLMLPPARRRGRKMAYYNVGAGPVETPAGRRMLRRLSELMDFITVRDRASLDILREIGVRHPRMAVAADAALNGPLPGSDRVAAIFARLGLSPDDDILALNVNPYLGTWSGTSMRGLSREEFVRTYVTALNRVLQRLRVPVLLVATQHLDVPLTREIRDKLVSVKPVIMVSNVDHDHYDMKALLGRVDLLFAMRLHSMILASSCHTPVAGLAYQPKIHHYFQALGLEEYSLDFSRFSAETLTTHVMRAWEDRFKLRERLDGLIPELQERALLSAELVACLHREDDLDATFAKLFG